MTWVYRRPFDYREKPSRLFLLLLAASAASGSSDLTFASSGTLTGDGALSGTCAIGFSVSAEHGSIGNLVGSSDIAFATTAILLGQGALVGSSSVVVDAAAVLSASAAFNPIYQKPPVRWSRPSFDYAQAQQRLVIFPLNVPSGISGQADLSFANTTGVLTGIASIAGSTSTVVTVSGTLLGSGELAGSIANIFTVEGVLAGTASGDISGSTATTFTPSATLTGAGSLEGTASNTFSASLAPGSIQQIVGSASILFDVSGVLIEGQDIRVASRRKRGVRLSRSKRGLKLS